MAKQNYHHARFNVKGNCNNSAGQIDRNKAVKTKSDGRLHWTLLDIYPILKNVNVIYKDKVFPEQVICSNDGTNNDVFYLHGFDTSLKNVYIQGQSNQNGQDVDFSAAFHLPYLFTEWDTTSAITGQFYVSDQTDASVDVTIYSPGSANALATKLWASMTKTVVGPGNIARVQFTFSLADMYSLVPSFKYGIENAGTETVVVLLKATLEEDAWIKLVGETFVSQCNIKAIQDSYTDGWEDPLCGTCDVCDACDYEACGLCEACDGVADSCSACDVCDGADE